MSTFLTISQSEFMWVIVIGILLSSLGAWVSTVADTRRRRRATTALFHDLVTSVCELIETLDDHRTRHRVIDREFVELIAVEVQVYGRNREHLVIFDDAKLRRDIQGFFTKVGATLAQVQAELNRFYSANQGTLPGQPSPVSAVTALASAYKACGRLKDLAKLKDALEKRLRVKTD